MEFTASPVGYVHSDCKQMCEVPLNGKDDILGGVIEILPQFSECILGLEKVKYIWVFSFLHLADRSIQQVQPVHRRHLHPRGVFATCSPVRPNPIGKSFMEIQKIDGLKIYVKGLDLVDGTPILDIKLYDEGSDQPNGLC
ncbi:hypothetical protein TVAG_259180 [Trichomonas vaginalis G3]|uniref:TsaA-like domain-containing protein n=1 Tax=Trichomonas vaginalis (strain ATCC PRA-98 / G3) TaxID=412133 RepID=A2EBW9_TRIV3|nr:tRNA (adenine-N6-)-methyltransferase protein [Trichomonas vaginalis G3]EAY09837.1 hypothetical protein TVAG_259180 [Trichomonas vaginalis G3]KAI5505933.1 tRNA (adenine-N6-)-methyltransferase protein [Trichomonas vaginalis G3]|eukprot:XP_001322060.1 hypothetical protein [Trichomonas vaginalis G3]